MFFSKLFHFPRRLRKVYYKLWNSIKFRLVGIRLGKRFEGYGRIYISVHPKSNVVIGDDCKITSDEAYNPLSRNIRACICAERENAVIKIGNHTGMSSPCVWAKQKIIIGDFVNIGADCILMDSDAHDLDWKIRDSLRKSNGRETLDTATAKCAPIIIEDHVLIGTRCIILKGVTIGARSVIAAGSVVTKSIPKDCIAGGNPAKVIRELK